MAKLRHPHSFPFLTLREGLLLGIAILGILLRLVQFLANRSLWLDECFMALNLRAKSFTELLLALNNDQAAPIGFLLAEKAAIQVLGDSEYALRLFPLLAGIASILLFWRLGRYCLRPNALLLALGLFAISGPLIYYSSEVKQYSGDVAVALFVYLIALAQLRRDRWDLGSVALLSLGGGLAIWFSHSVIFVLAGIAVTVGTTLIVARRRSEAIHVGAVGVVWIVSFAANYLINLRRLTANSSLSDYWQTAFVPFPPRSFAEIRWLSYSVFDVFVDPGGFTLYGLATLCFLAGCVSLFSRHKTQLFLFLSPVRYLRQSRRLVGRYAWTAQSGDVGLAA